VSGDRGPSKFTPFDGAHYLHPQKSSRVPRRYVFFDTEAWRTESHGGEVQTWRLGVTGTIVWNEDKHAWGPLKLARHSTTQGLWEAVTGFARKDARTVVVAHNLAYDLRISAGMEHLPAAGWSIEKPTFSGKHVSLEAVKDERRLVLVDSMSVLPHSLATIGAWLGTPKPPLPADDDPEETWWDRCEADVRILAQAYMTVIEWIDQNDLGGWARSGPGIGWHVLLRSHLTDNVLVHRREEVREAEAAAMYAGRAEVWRHGVLKGGPWYEWDFALAYGHVCAENYLPAVLLDEVHGGKLEHFAARWPGLSFLVEAEVTTAVPVLPWSDELGIAWPVGQFTGWWWDHELLAAVAVGATVKVLRAWRYRAAPWLSSWALWCMEQVADSSTPQARIRGAAAKHWTRAVPGRSAMRYRSWEPAGPAWVPGVGYMPLVDHDTGARGAALVLGDQHWEAWSLEWWDQALPQVLSAVMAHCRVRLWHALQAAGFENVVYCDTDSLIVSPAGNSRLTEAVRDGRLWSLRLKGTHDYLAPIAPQLVEGSTYRRLAGVPKGALRTGASTYDGEIWEGITTSMAAGHPHEVRVRRSQLALTGIDTRRLHLPGGQTAPFTVAGGRRLAQAEVAS
jgi:hypothetical protein